MFLASLVLARLSLSFLFLLTKMNFQSVVVGAPGTRALYTDKNKSKELRLTRRELQAPVPWATYDGGDGKRVTTNARLVRRTWRKDVKEAGPGVEVALKVLHPWVHVDKWGRLDLRIDVLGVGRNIYWHHLLWYSRPLFVENLANSGVSAASAAPGGVWKCARLI